jgi:hypothetical protein
MLGAIGDRCARIVVERAKQSGLESPEVVVQGVDHNAERDVALELGCAPVKHQSAALLSADAKLCQQPGLADPGSPTSWTNHGSRNPNRAPLKLGDFTPGPTGVRDRCRSLVLMVGARAGPISPHDAEARARRFRKARYTGHNRCS